MFDSQRGARALFSVPNMPKLFANERHGAPAMLISAFGSRTREFKVAGLIRSLPPLASIAALKYPGVPLAMVLAVSETMPTSEKPFRKGFFSASLTIRSEEHT